MDFFAHPIVAIGLLLGILVLFHELGHFLVGKSFGIPVETFSIGFGPVIFGLKRGLTHYRVCLLPLGGYVKFYGSTRSETVPEFLKGKEFFSSSVPARICTIAAGPIANIILAILVFTSMAMYGVHQPPPTIGEIMPGSPAARAGLEFGDTILSIEGEQTRSWKDIQRKI